MAFSKTSYDLTVVGGGIFGLWVAKRAVEVGLSVVLVEKRHVGAGASGGLLGALMPHMPNDWNAKKQFQFDALTALPDQINALEDETGLETGYGRIGRLMPLRTPRFKENAGRSDDASKNFWNQESGSFRFGVHEDNTFQNWLSPTLTPLGYVLDTLGARVNPRHYVRALHHWLSTRIDLVEGVAYSHFEDGTASFENADSVATGAVVLAQGYETFNHLKDQFHFDIGTGVKGQVAKFELAGTADMPVIYDDGVYIVPHDDGSCAVGSTAHKTWDNPATPDLTNTGFLDKARKLCPRLTNLVPVAHWAGVRPRCYQTEPVIGRLLKDRPIYAATGGYKVSFGLAHHVAKALVDEITGSKVRVELPETFRPVHHLKTKPNRITL